MWQPRGEHLMFLHFQESALSFRVLLGVGEGRQVALNWSCSEQRHILPMGPLLLLSLESHLPPSCLNSSFLSSYDSPLPHSDNSGCLPPCTHFSFTRAGTISLLISFFFFFPNIPTKTICWPQTTQKDHLCLDHSQSFKDSSPPVSSWLWCLGCPMYL